MRSVELTLGADADAAVRAWWSALTEAGVPSLGLHDAASNRPHVSLEAGPTIGPVSGLQSVASLVPEAVRFAGFTLFPGARGRFVLARGVVVDGALARLHRAVHEALPGGLEHTLPDRWTPHVTISRRLSPEGIARALEVLADLPVPEVAAVEGLRFWDGETGTLTVVA